MAHGNRLDFLPKKNNLRLLQVATLFSLVGCIAMVSLLLTGAGRGGDQTAAIADSTEALNPTSTPSDRIAAKPKAISENPVTSAAIGTTADTVRYYETATGKAFSVNVQTLRTDVLSDQRLSGFKQSWWAPRSDRVISSFQQSDGIQYRSYDYSTKESAVIGSSIAGLAISPDGSDVAYLDNDGEAMTLFVAKIDGSSPRQLLRTRTQEVHLTWPTRDTLSLSSRRSDRPGYDLSTIDLQGNLISVITNKENLEYVWSPDGTQLLYSYFTSDSGINLWLHDIRSGMDLPLGTHTSARKCAWLRNGLSIVCGVPAKNSLSRDVPADHSATIDDIISLNLFSGEQQRLYGGVSGTLIGVIDPLIPSSEDHFVFTNLFDNRLYLIPL